MSFIFGIVSLNNEAIDTKNIRTLCNAVKWNGFEDCIDVHNKFAIGYCWNRDRAPKAGIYNDEHVTVICDARIYNMAELLKEISFATPEEAFAQAYFRWGNLCADKFNGDFSVVIIDHKLQKIILFRDHIGVRPLCYTIQNKQLIFASHEFGIAKSRLIKNVISEEALIRNFLMHKKQKYNLTVFENILKIVPGHYMSISTQKIELKRYWFPEKIKKNKQLTLSCTIMYLRHHIIEATKNRIEPGMIGTHISGGLDSTGIAAILADCIDDKNRLIGYSWSPKDSIDPLDDGIDENELIDNFCTQKNILVKYRTWNEENIIDNFILPEFEYMKIEIQTMEQAKFDDIKTIFTGWGGDEFTSLNLRGAINHIVLCFNLVALFRWIKHFGIKSTIMRIKKEVLPLFIPLFSTDSLKKSPRRKFFKRSFIIKHWNIFFFDFPPFIYGWGNQTKFMMNLLKHLHLPKRMDSWAYFGEKYGLEYKYPLLDKKLLEFWFSVPVKHTYRTMIPRHLYREAMKDILPECIRTRMDKRDGSMNKCFLQNNKRIKKELAKHMTLFSENDAICFLKTNEFKKLVLEQYQNTLALNIQLANLRLFLRYKKICEKYLIGKT